MSNNDPDRAFRDAMARYDLDPGPIKWGTPKPVRFPGPGKKKSNDDGWYVGFADQRGGVFGDHSRKIHENWQICNGKKPDDLDDAEWARMQEEMKQAQEEREAARLEEERAAAVKSRERWAKASRKISPKHAYLKKKGITDTKGIRLEGDNLLVPMKSFEKGNPIVSLQRITPKGDKQYAYGGRVTGTRSTIGGGAFKQDPTIYLCEGWATGWTINHVTGKAVVVAFDCGNLMAVARELRKEHPGARIIIAADNDRWTSTYIEGEPAPNPGLSHALHVLKHIDEVEYAIPDFESLDGKPTDFNDLWMREGAEAVELWLDPTRTSEATTSVEPEPEPGQPPPPRPVLEDRPWTENPHFRCLGYDRGTFYYLPRAGGQIVQLSPSGHDRKTLLPLAPLTWWEATFPSKQGANWTVAADALIQNSYQRGVFKVDLLRGRGCWPASEGEDGVVLHLGDRLLPPDSKTYVDPEKYESDVIYERHGRLVGPSDKRALDLEEAQDVLSLCQDLLWHEEASGYLLAGWIALAPLCGALPWRPHIWLTGGAGSGKTTIMQRIVDPLMGGMRRMFEGGSTEAGMRQRLRADALPVLYDEAEATGARADARVQAVLGLARSASSTGHDAETAKGTTHGEALSFQVRSMFCLASIGGAIKHEQDKQRISLLQLRGRAVTRKEERDEHWSRFAPRLEKVDTKLGRELVARTLSWLRDGRLNETLSTFKAAASTVLGDARSGDQYGTLLAGAWTLMSDDVPDPLEARELISAMDLSQYLSEQQPEGLRVLQTILQQRERIETKNGPQTVAVGQLVDVLDGKPGPVTDSEANGLLRQIGLRVDVVDGDRVLMVAHSSEWISKALKDTPYADNVGTPLRTIEGVKPGGQIRFHPGLACRTTMVPLAALDRTG